MNDEKGWLDRRPNKGTLWLMAAIGVAGLTFLLWEDHKAHLLGALPWLIVLACPLMHLFMHRRHGHKRPDKPGDGSDD